MTNLEIALKYLEKGLSVIPLWSAAMIQNKPPKGYVEQLEKELAENSENDNPLSEEEIRQNLLIEKCKTPIVAWTEYQKRLPTIDELSAWFAANPTANIGIVTGKVSNLVVFDLDSKEAEQYAEEEGGFPETPKVKTGKGYHIYMKYPGFEVKNRVNKKLAVDIRGDGGYVVAPPSIHGSGRRYSWEEGYSIFEIDPAACTPWMLDYMKSVSAEEPKHRVKEEAIEMRRDPTEVSKEKSRYTDILRHGCGKGNRNDTATSLIGHLLKKGMEPDEVWELAKIWNKEKNSPPLEDPELKRTFESVKKEEARNRELKLEVSAFLDDEGKIAAEFSQNYIRIPFGGNNLSFLENRMNGGLAGGRLYIFGGIPSSGKTVLLNNIADNICLNEYPVLFFSYDDGKAELRSRTFARLTEYDIEEFNMGSMQGIEGLCNLESVKKIREHKYVIEKLIPVEEWDDLVEQIRSKHNKGPGIIIDYLRKLRTKSKISDERLRVDDIISKLTDLAKKFNIPILSISELARDSYKSGQRLSMASFKESGTIEYEASWLGILAAVEEINGEYQMKENWERIIEHDGNIDLIVFKAKRGTGATGKIPLKLNKSKMTVSDRADQNHFFQGLMSGKKSRFSGG